MNRSSNNELIHHSSQRRPFCIGILFLLVCVVIWVTFSEASKHFFIDSDYNKPYLITYFNTSILFVYLLGFLIQKSWRKKCIQCACDDYPGQYLMIAGTDTEDTDDGLDLSSNALSDPIYIPLDVPSDNEAEKDDKRRVKFSNLKEVRELEDGKYAHMARMSYIGSLRAKLLMRKQVDISSISHTAKTSAVLSMLYFSSHICYREALLRSDMEAIVVVMFSFVVLFTLILSAIFQTDYRDKFSFVKFFSASISIGGIVLVSISTSQELTFNVGAVWALASAFCNSMFLVFAKKFGGKELNVFMLFGFIGFFTLVFYWPGLFAVHYSHWEEFVVPSREAIVYCCINALLVSLVANVLWLYSCLLTSPFVAALACTLTPPLRVTAQILFQQIDFSWKFIAGAIPVILVFIFVIQSETGFCIGNCRRSRRKVEEEMQMNLLSGDKNS